MHARTRAYVCIHTQTHTYFLCLVLVLAKEVGVIIWDANNHRSGTEGWTDELQRNATLHGAVAAARAWEGTACALPASKQLPSPLFRGAGKGYAALFHGTRKKGVLRQVHLLFPLYGRCIYFFFLLPCFFRTGQDRTACPAQMDNTRVMSSAGHQASVCRSETMSPGWRWA